MQPWMTFLNASLLAGTAAFAIPLVIHLLNRSRFKTIDWGAMIFIEDALRSNSRRIEWQKWLLLLLRCAIPICLALCMARPLLQSSTVLPHIQGTASIATCLLIDNSLSMDAKLDRPSGPPMTAFEIAKQDAMLMIQSSARNSRWSIDALGSGASHPAEFSSRDVERQATALKKMPRGSGNGDLLASLDRALASLAKSSESRRRIVVLSDFQKSMCEKIDPSQLAAMRQRCEAIPNPPSIYFARISQSDSQRKSLRNLTVQIDTLTRSVVGVSQPWEVRLVVRNFGAEMAGGLKLVLSIDGTAISSKSLDVPGNAETQLALGMSFTEAGSHRVEAKLEIDDAIATDNLASWSILALNTIPVLVVDPTLKDRKQTPESEFLNAALAPFSDTAEQRSNLFRVSRVSPDELSPDKVGLYKVIILANVARLNDSAVVPLMDHVRMGGILAIFAGDRIDPDWYNKRFGSTVFKNDESTPGVEQRCLPFLFDKTPQSIASNENGIKLRRENFQHPAVSFLNDTRVGSLDNMEVQSWYRMLPNSIDENNKSRVLLSLVNGDVFFAERTFGDGTILQCSTSVSDRWTNWPLRPIFLPMLQQLLLNSTPPIRWQMNVETGQLLNAPSPLLLDWIADGNSRASKSSLRRGISKTRSLSPSPPAPLPEDGERGAKTDGDLSADEDRFQATIWQLPDGREAHGDSVITDVPGTYSIDGLTEATVFLSAQAPIDESNLEVESEDGLKSLADRLGATMMGYPDDFAKLENRGNRELWRWFLVGLLALLFGELLIQRRLSGVAA